MAEELTLKGFWWNPGAPDRRLFGVLTQTDRAIELVCHTDHSEDDIFSDAPAGTIHGNDEKGRPVTLLLTTRVASTRLSGLETFRLHAGYVLVGIHVADKDLIRAQTISFEIQHLYGWLDMTGFKRQLSGNIAADGLLHVTIPYNTPDKTQYIVREGLTISFGVSANYLASIQTQSIHEDSYAIVTQMDGFNFEQVWKMAKAFRALIHFASLKPAYVVTMTLHCRMESTCDTATTLQEVTVWSCNFQKAETMLQCDTSWTYRYQDVSHKFGEFFDFWLTYIDQYGEALDCYMSTVYHKLPASVAFLCLTQALDAYHGVRFNSHKDTDFQKKVVDILKINTSSMSGLIEDVETFAKQVLASRNYYTHHNPKWLLQGNVAQGHGLMRMNEKLRILLQSCVIVDMGLPSERCTLLRSQIASEIVMY